MRTTLVVLLLLVSVSVCAEPLSSWNDGPVKDAITTWLAAITDPDGVDFIPGVEYKFW